MESFLIVMQLIFGIILGTGEFLSSAQIVCPQLANGETEPLLSWKTCADNDLQRT